MEEILSASVADNGVLTLTLNRPRAFNSLSLALLEKLRAELDKAASDSRTRVILIKGAQMDGRKPAFCSGHDLKEIGSDRRAEPIRHLFQTCSAMMQQIARQPQPVIACVDGIATAAGCQLVAACDLALCTQSSTFATSGVKFGLFCSTPMVALSRNVPRKFAMEMLLTGDFVSAQEALRYGLVNEVAADGELESAIRALTARLLDKPADVLALGKRAFYEQLEMSMSDAYALTTEVITKNAVGSSFAEGLDAFIHKRKPEWTN